ncbi:undecaprenyl-phosphate glucose phosphotransferase [uncultured Thiocystis sp.]|jgi:Undecaprenyl-phosphate glucose phosphotransferase|uniref:undecaprenyl-phosphate glucose phosphotransferase n=1 Tax=uncultured Thiocystis sp. TaxID=1202134 RepID=UPI0025F28549|nr:undecaprenyl-phosphate glucose phosphotransferase [uncultured Thiocystis sp.]
MPHLSIVSGKLNYVLYFSDIGFLTVAAIALYYVFDLSETLTIKSNYALAIVIAIASYTAFTFSNETYDWRKLPQQVKKLFPTFGGVIFAFGSVLITAFALKITSDFSRLWLGFWFAGFTAYILVSRVFLIRYFAKGTNDFFPQRRTLIIGARHSGQKILDQILLLNDQGLEVAGFLDDLSPQLPHAYRGIPIIQDITRVADIARNLKIDLVILTQPWNRQERLDELLKTLANLSLDIYLAIDKLPLRYSEQPIFRVSGLHVLSIKDRPISEWNAVIKRIEDLCIAIPAIILLSPLMAIVAIAIKLESKGDVLFAQDRFGFNNNLINIYKFRSMYTDMTDRAGCQQTVHDDPRVTRVGRFIRKTSIDEIPQLFNVLLGNMSLVGPRPHPTGMQSEGRLLHEAIDDYASRHRVKPGITGWAQCNGWRGETDTRKKIEKRIEYDLYYIENWSLFLDLLALVKTGLLLIRKDAHAY